MDARKSGNEETVKWRNLYLTLNDTIVRLTNRFGIHRVVDETTGYVYIKSNKQRYCYILEAVK